MLLVSITIPSTRVRDRLIDVTSWTALFAAITVVVALIGFAKRGGVLEGWSGSPGEQLLGWTLLIAPYVALAWAPLAIGLVALAYLLSLSRRTVVALALILSVGVVLLLGVVA